MFIVDDRGVKLRQFDKIVPKVFFQIFFFVFGYKSYAFHCYLTPTKHCAAAPTSLAIATTAAKNPAYLSRHSKRTRQFQTFATWTMKLFNLFDYIIIECIIYSIFYLRLL